MEIYSNLEIFCPVLFAKGLFNKSIEDIKILDIGCGVSKHPTANFYDSTAYKLLDSNNYFGLDLDDNNENYLQNGKTLKNFEQYNLIHPLFDTSFSKYNFYDIIIFNNSLHFQELKDCRIQRIKEALSLLTKNGVIYLKSYTFNKKGTGFNPDAGHLELSETDIRNISEYCSCKELRNGYFILENKKKWNLQSKIEQLSTYSKDNSNQHGEVFTPFILINKMLDYLSKETFKDSSKTFFDPTAGKGNMPAIIVERLMAGLVDEFPDELKRYTHIMEKQIFMAELQRESAQDIDKIFNPTGKLKLNLFVGDSLKIPEDFWDLPFDERIKEYPKHYVYYTPRSIALF